MIITDLSPDHVQVQEVIGSDEAIAKRARICMRGLEGSEQPFIDSQHIAHFINSLIRQEHTSPFEFGGLTISIKCPIFVARQWMRHRTFRYLERSGRYCTSTNEIYLPERLKNDKEVVKALETLFDKYEHYTEHFSKQEARIMLPLGMYTEFVFQADLHNLLHFIKLRTANTAQAEIRFYANCVSDKVREHFPMTWNSYMINEMNKQY